MRTITQPTQHDTVDSRSATICAPMACITGGHTERQEVI